MTCGNLLLRNLLFFSLISSVCAGAFEVNATQTSYQAEENKDITLEFVFTANADASSNPINILLELLADEKPLNVFCLIEGVESLSCQDEQFAGRVQYNKGLLREGRLRLNVSRLGTRDSGPYLCTVGTSYESGAGRCSLNVTAARRLPKPETPSTSRPPPKSGGSVNLYWALGLGLGLGLPGVVLLVVVCFLLCRPSPPREQDEINHSARNLEERVHLHPITPSRPNEQGYVAPSLQEDDPIIRTLTKGQDSPSEESYSSGYGGGETDSQS